MSTGESEQCAEPVRALLVAYERLVRLRPEQAEQVRGAIASAEDWGRSMTTWNEEEYQEYRAAIARAIARAPAGQLLPRDMAWERLALAYAKHFRMQNALAQGSR